MKPIESMSFEGACNLLAVNEDGSPTSTQIWEGGAREAARTLLNWIERGNDKTQTWDKPLVNAYIYSHKTRETWFLDLTDQYMMNTLVKIDHAQPDDRDFGYCHRF